MVTTCIQGIGCAPEAREGRDPEDAGQYTAVYAHMDHLAASSTNADIAGRAKHVSVNYRW